MSWLFHFIRIHSVLKYAGVFQPVANMQEAISLVRRYQIKSEIIGQWLYCYPNLLLGIQLLCIGFWFSTKHGAYVYSGKPKEGEADDETLDEIRARLGCQKILEVYHV
jgi:hypothetical protein